MLHYPQRLKNCILDLLIFLSATELENEKNLINKIKDSDPEAFRELYYLYSPKIYAFIWRKTGNETLAADFTQEVFIKVWNNRGSLNAEKNIKAYLFTTANNICIDHFRKIKPINVDIENIHLEEVYYLNENFDIPENIKTEIDKLPRMQRNVIYLSRFEGLSHKEISEMLGISKKTVENHMGRALSSLRKTLEYLLSILILIIFFFSDGC